MELRIAIGQRAASGMESRPVGSPRGSTESENAAPRERPRPGAPGKLAAREIHELDESRPTGSDTLDNLAEEQL